jgi:hypothetical protein
MGLGDWINRNLVEYKPEDPPPQPDDPPEERARRVQLVPMKPAAELLEEIEPTDFSTLAPEGDDAPAETSAPAAPAVVALPTSQPDPLDDGGEPPISVPQVYEAAHIEAPKHGFTLEKLAGMLADPRLAKLDAESRASAIAVVLETSGVKLGDIVKDAAARDAALDQFENFLATKLVDRQVSTDQRVARIREEIDAFVARKQDEIQLIEGNLKEKQVELARFRRVKRAEELRLLEVVRHFTKEPTISLGDETQPTHPQGDPPPPAPGA